MAINELNVNNTKIGFRMNMERTKVMCNLFVEVNTINTELKFVGEIKHLGRIMNKYEV